MSEELLRGLNINVVYNPISVHFRQSQVPARPNHASPLLALNPMVVAQIVVGVGRVKAAELEEQLTHLSKIASNREVQLHIRKTKMNVMVIIGT
jgi:hypothetical protein